MVVDGIGEDKCWGVAKGCGMSADDKLLPLPCSDIVTLPSSPLKPLVVNIFYTLTGWGFYCSPCRLYGPTHSSPPHLPVT